MDNDFERERDNDMPEENSGQGTTPVANFNEYFNSAMRSALVVGVGFLLQALAVLTFQWGFVSSLLYLVGLVLVPILLYITGKRYFDTQVTGPIPYLSAAAYLFWTFLLSLIIAALVYYIAFYFMFRNPAITEALSQSMEMIGSMMEDDAMRTQLADSYAQMTPKSMTLSTCSTFFFFGTVYVYIIAIFLRRS